MRTSDRFTASPAGGGYKANYFDVESGDRYWISGPKRNGQDALYPTNVKPYIDANVADEYWSEIRHLPRPRAKAGEIRTEGPVQPGNCP